MHNYFLHSILIYAFFLSACSVDSMNNEPTPEAGMELYQPLLGTWKNESTGTIIKEFVQLGSTKGSGSTFFIDKNGKCEGNYKYSNERYFTWTMVDTTLLPFITIQKKETRVLSCGEPRQVSNQRYQVGYKIEEDTLKNGGVRYIRQD